MIRLVLMLIAAGLLARWLPTRRSRAFGLPPAGFPVQQHSVNPARALRAIAQRRSVSGAFAC